MPESDAQPGLLLPGMIVEVQFNDPSKTIGATCRIMPCQYQGECWKVPVISNDRAAS
ncbi:MAG: hypothetical protein JKY50_03695 [Oleispira sp.]|nr:hypothetical protein [Oleispira sp.]